MCICLLTLYKLAGNQKFEAAAEGKLYVCVWKL